MSLTTWEINGLELELDIEDAETSEKYFSAFEKMEQKEKEIQKNGKYSEFIKAYSNMFYELFDNLFGTGTAEKIFDGKKNARLCDEVYDNFLSFVKKQSEEALNRRNSIKTKYNPNNRLKNNKYYNKKRRK